MWKCLRLQCFFVLLAMGSISSVASIDFLKNLDGFVPNIPEFNPSLFPQSKVQPCSGYEKSFWFIELINGIQNTKRFDVKNDPDLTLCEGSMKRLSTITGQYPTACQKCDHSYVVLILSKKNGEMIVTGEGIKLKDGSIITLYLATQLGDEGEKLWVKDLTGTLQEVRCMKKISSKHLLTEIYFVQLFVGPKCFCDDGYSDCIVNKWIDIPSSPIYHEPEFITSPKSFLPVPGCLLHQSNSTPSFTTYSITSTSALYIDDPTDVGVSFMIPDQPKKIGPASRGAPIVDQNCKILGLFLARPIVLINTQRSVPFLQDIATQCLAFIMPIDLEAKKKCFSAKNKYFFKNSYLPSLLKSLTKINPSFPVTKLQACLDYEDFSYVKLQDAIEESKVIEVEKTNFSPALCEGHVKRVAESFRINSTTCQKCDLSYVVLILSKKNDQIIVTGQGIRLANGSIITAYASTLVTDGGLLVKYHNEALAKVKCMRRLYCKHEIAKVNLIQLDVEPVCSCDPNDDNFSENCLAIPPASEPKFETCPRSPIPVAGCLALQRNSNITITDYTISPSPGLLIYDDQTNIGTSILIADEPSRVGFGFAGGAFVGQNCQILGMGHTVPTIITEPQRVVAGKEIATECILVIAPIEF